MSGMRVPLGGQRAILLHRKTLDLREVVTSKAMISGFESRPLYVG